MGDFGLRIIHKLKTVEEGETISAKFVAHSAI